MDSAHSAQISQMVDSHQAQVCELNSQYSSQVSFHQTNTNLQAKKYQTQISDLNSELDTERKTVKDLKFTIQNMNDQIVEMEETIYQFNETQLELVTHLENLEVQNKLAEKKIRELIASNEDLEKGQAIYIGHRHDKIDTALADFINLWPERQEMKIMFIRESEGVYQFGQKKIHIKVERGNQILVRVGGGYMHIDEFIRQYTPEEVEKISRRDVLERFANKASI